MNNAIRKLLKVTYKTILPVMLFVLLPFYDKKYLRGKWFKSSYMGLVWAFKGIFWQKLCGFNRHIPWPVSPFIEISNGKNLVFDPDDLNNFQGRGNYFQNFNAKIYIGKGTYIAMNVGIITSNHDVNNLDEHLLGQDVKIGASCWLGMNSIILPGVVLGERTVVGAGSVVTKSFPEGHSVIVGNPARLLRKI